MPNSRYYSSIAAATNLQVTANPGDTSIQVASSSGWPGSFPFIISLDYGSANEELVLVTAGGPTSFTVTRAYDGTSASTHNAGAVVRHVSSAIDFTDSRTHEASATGVHGVTGQIVDTASVQSVANKTFTSTTLNSPTISGTVAGNQTYSGTQVHSAAVTNNGSTAINGTFQVTSNSVLVERTLAADNAFRARLTGDANSRYIVNADGRTAWGDGTGASDVALFRSGAGALSLTGSLAVSGTVSAATGTFTSLSGAFTPVTATDAAVFANNVNWSLDSAAGRKAGGVTTIRVNVERSLVTTITADTKGNIGDTIVGTLQPGWRPIDGTMITNYDKGGVAEGSISIGNDGVCTIKSLSPTAEINLADTVNFSLTFVSAT